MPAPSPDTIAFLRARRSRPAKTLTTPVPGADEAVLDARGLPDPEKVAPFVYLPEVQRYHGLGAQLGRAFESRRKILRTAGPVCPRASSRSLMTSLAGRTRNFFWGIWRSISHDPQK